MKTLQIEEKKARELYKTASEELKKILEDTFGKDFLSEKVTDRVETYEDAMKETGRPDVPEFSELPEDIREYFKAQYKILVITEALNEGWKADWKDENQKKWVPWFEVSPSGFVFSDTYYRYSYPYAGYASRLCFKNEELAEYAGKQFVELYRSFIM